MHRTIVSYVCYLITIIHDAFITYNKYIILVSTETPIRMPREYGTETSKLVGLVQSRPAPRKSTGDV